MKEGSMKETGIIENGICSDKKSPEQTVRYYPRNHEHFPEALKYLADVPKGIYVKGQLPDSSKPAVAIVGARVCSDYGKTQAYEIARYLSSYGVQIISGLARGVDGHAHQGALDGGTPTFAVLGCGLDTCYPRQHISLWTQILEAQGGILSEYPMCTPPLKSYFPQRNRIISGLADLVIIIEAKKQSGSLITADCALEQGKTVYALPGRIWDALSCGCNYLIAQGAGILYSPECILEELHIDKKRTKEEKINFGLASEIKLVYSVLGFEPKKLDDLSKELQIPPEKLSESLLQLELEGLIKQVRMNYYRKT